MSAYDCAEKTVFEMYGKNLSPRAKSVFIFMLHDNRSMALEFVNKNCLRELSVLDADLISFLLDQNYKPKLEWLAQVFNAWSAGQYDTAKVSLHAEKLHPHQITWLLKIKKILLHQSD